MALSDIKPEYNEADLKKDTAPKNLRRGGYLLRATKVTQKINEKGNMILSLAVNPVDSNGDTRTPGAFLSLVGPFRTPPALLEEAKLPPNAQVKVPNTLFIITAYAQARRNAKSPFAIDTLNKVKKVGNEWFEADGVTPAGSKDERMAKNMEIAKAARDFYIESWGKSGENLIGDEFYGSVDYNPSSGFDGPQVSIHASKEAMLADEDFVKAGLSYIDVTPETDLVELS